MLGPSSVLPGDDRVGEEGIRDGMRWEGCAPWTGAEGDKVGWRKGWAGRVDRSKDSG